MYTHAYVHQISKSINICVYIYIYIYIYICYPHNSYQTIKCTSTALRHHAKIYIIRLVSREDGARAVPFPIRVSPV